jgi:hypothetical protein
LLFRVRKHLRLCRTTSLTYNREACSRSSETKLFTRLVHNYFTDDEYAALQNSIVANPEAGDVIRGSGGVRKLPWGVAGRGKRGGVRVIYYLRLQQGQVWMLTLYAKNEADNIPSAVLKKIKEELDGKD